jgi:hypothetical protein
MGYEKKASVKKAISIFFAGIDHSRADSYYDIRRDCSIQLYR